MGDQYDMLTKEIISAIMVNDVDAMGLALDNTKEYALDNTKEYAEDNTKEYAEDNTKDNKSDIRFSNTFRIPEIGARDKNTPSKIILPNEQLGFIHIAAFANATECFIYLNTICNIPLDTPTGTSLTPLYYACCGGSIEIAGYILEHWDNPRVSPFALDYPAALAPFSLPFLASYMESPDILIDLFEHGYDAERALNASRIKYNEAYKQAVTKRNVRCLEVLLKNSKIASSSNNLTPLMIAIINNREDAVNMLLDAGAIPEQLTIQHESALSYACKQNEVEIAKTLVQRMTQIDIPDNIQADGAVHWLCTARDPTLARLMLEKDIMLCRLNKSGSLGAEKLLNARESEESIEVLDILISHGYDINWTDGRGATLIGYCLITPSSIRPLKTIEYLLQKGARTDVPMPPSPAFQMMTVAQYMERFQKLRGIGDLYHKYVEVKQV